MFSAQWISHFTFVLHLKSVCALIQRELATVFATLVALEKLILQMEFANNGQNLTVLNLANFAALKVQ
jgi:hypothetical protein